MADQLSIKTINLLRKAIKQLEDVEKTLEQAFKSRAGKTPGYDEIDIHSLILKVDEKRRNLEFRYKLSSESTKYPEAYDKMDEEELGDAPEVSRDEPEEEETGEEETEEEEEKPIRRRRRSQ